MAKYSYEEKLKIVQSANGNVYIMRKDRKLSIQKTEGGKKQ